MTDAIASASEGSLDEASAPTLFVLAWRDKQTGRLRFTRDDEECVVQIENGSPMGTDSNAPQPSFVQSLVDDGTLSASDRVNVLTFVKEKRCAEASAVLTLGLLDAKTIYGRLRETTRQHIRSVCDWHEGTWAWDATESDAAAAGKPFDVLKLVLGHLSTTKDIESRVEALLPDPQRILELTPHARRVANKLGETSPSAQGILDTLNGSTSIGNVLGNLVGDPTAAAMLWVLVTAGLVRDHESLMAGTNQDYDFEVVVAAGLGRSASRGAGTDAASAPGANAAAPRTANPKAEALHSEITEMISRLDDLTHYGALGIESNANAAQIKKAYFKAAKKYHPDSLARLGLDELREEAAQVFGRIAEAFETLSDETKRAAYDSGDSDQTEIDTARLTQAETSFRKGEILVRMGNFAGALEYLEPAVELWPEEPAYQAELGWALFKQPQSDLERAREHLETAHSQQPEDARILYRLGLVLRGLGDRDASEDCILRARAIDPDVSD